MKKYLVARDESGTPAIRALITRSWRGSENVLTEIKLKKGEPVESAPRRLKKKVDREGTLKVVRNHRRKEKAAVLCHAHRPVC